MEKAEKVYNNFKVVFCKVDNDAALLVQENKPSEPQEPGWLETKVAIVSHCYYQYLDLFLSDIAQDNAVKTNAVEDD